MLLAARDRTCDIVVVEVDTDGTVNFCHGENCVPYELLWKAIKNTSWTRVVNWCLTFRSSYVLRKTNWLDALENGEIELERQRKLAGKQAGRGSVVLSSDMTDLDLRVGGRKIKLLDWNNFGVDPSQYVKSLNDLTAENCLQIFADWIKAQSKVGLSASRTSAPQIGWAKLRQSLGKSDIFTSLDPSIRALERRCYYGGRCEPFRLGDVNEKVYLLDIRACYAAVCVTLAVPTQPLRYWPDGVSHDSFILDEQMCVAADCVVNTSAPVFPVRHLGRVIYPTGRFFTSLCGSEFDFAARGGMIEKITRAVIYAPAPALIEYALWYIASRDAMSSHGHAKMASSIKSAFNSSLGFFARQGREWCEWSPAGSPQWWFGKTTDPNDYSKVVGAHVLDRESELLRIGSEPRNCAPIVHAAICSQARIALATLIAIAGAEHVVYCDTDGLIVTQQGYDSLLAAKDVCGLHYGQLSVRAQSLLCTINGQKNYKIGDKVVCAGLTQDRHHTWRKRDVLDTPTGIVEKSGKVAPYVMDCEDVGDEKPSWKNTLRQA